MTELPGDEAGAVVSEHAVLLKFDGDLTQEDIESGEHEPVEKIVIQDGEIIEHWRKEDEVN